MKIDKTRSPRNEGIKARKWFGERPEYRYKCIAPYPMTEQEIRERLGIQPEEKLTPQKDRRMIHDGYYVSIQKMEMTEK